MEMEWTEYRLRDGLKWENTHSSHCFETDEHRFKYNTESVARLECKLTGPVFVALFSVEETGNLQERVTPRASTIFADRENHATYIDATSLPCNGDTLMVMTQTFDNLFTLASN